MAISMKGSFARVIKPISEAVLKPYLKSWQFWGNVTCDFERIREGNDLVGFIIDVVTTHGTYRHTFKRETDQEGFYTWKEAKVEKLTA